MNTNHDDRHRKDVNEEVMAGPNDSSYRTTFRSNILKRIYEKNSRLPSDVIENVLDRENDDETKDFSNEDQRPKTLKSVPLSNEWRKTLERILNYDQGYLDGQLEVSRKDALCFFIQKEWPTEGENKSRRGKKKSKKSPSPDREVFSSVLVQRRPAITWKEMIDGNTMKISSVLGDKVKNQDAVSGYVLRKDSTLYERYIVRPLQSLDYLHSLSYLFRRNESSKAFKLFSWFYNSFVQYSSENNQIIKSPKSSQVPHQQNNNRFQLEVTLAEISFSKHYLMDEECRLIRLLHVAYERYRKSISPRTSHQLARVNEVIAAIVAKMETTSKNIDKAEHELDIDLLQRLVDYQRATINKRRKSLIELLRIWDHVVSHKSASKLITSNCLNLKLEETPHTEEDKERTDWNRLVEQSTRWEKLIQDKSEVNRENVKSVTFLYDGRLPGEPKFSSIELVYDRLKVDNDRGLHLDVLYTIQISIGEKTLVQFDPLYLESDFSNLKWNQSVSIAFPWFPNAQHTLNYSSLEEHCRQYLPTIAIYEKHGRKGAKAGHEPRLIWQQQVADLPRFYQKSANNAKLFETDFEFAFKEEEESDNRLRIKGSLQLCTFWASLPFDAKTIADSSAAEIIFDQEKRQIRQMTDLKAIDQTLHDLRYLDAINLDTFAVDNSTSADSMRRIQLMDLCLRQKYHIELNNNLLQKEEITRKHKSVIKEMEQPKNLDLGTFCSDEEIEQNKRFQLMIYRNSGANRNYRNLRFIPLSNVTDVMLQNVILTEKTEKLSIEILLDYIRTSCEEQEKQILCLNKKKRRKKKNAENGSKIFHDWCLATSAQGGTNRLLMSAPNWVQTVGQVLDKIELDRQSLNGESLNTGGFLSNRSCNLTFEDIIREELIESLDGTEFSFCLPFANMNRSKLNPNRKDRRKVAITLTEALDREVQVVLSLQHALNVPLRTSTRRQSEEVHEEDDEDKEERLTPCATCVEILYDNQNISSSIADGSQPTWNENFRFKIKLDPRQYITLNLFEVLKSVRSSSLSSEPSTTKAIRSTTKQAPDSNDETAAQELNEANTHLQLEKRYFGQFKIPLFSILFNSKIEGTFSLSSPYFLQGYKSVSTSASKSIKKSRLQILEQSEEGTRNTDAKLLSTVNLMQSLYSNDAEQTLLGSLPDIALSLFIAIDPPIEPVPGFQFSQKNASVESAELVELCNRWRTQLCTQFHNRHYICLVETVQHKLVLACRYLSPIKPPDLNELIQLDQIVLSKGKGKVEDSSKRTKLSMKKLVHREAIYLNLIIRFVSLMPTFSGNPPSGNLIDQSWWWRLSKSGTVWLDAAQFLSFRIGFQVEHAVYLCCMLQYLDRNAYLLYGTSLLEGPTGYVLLYPASTMLSSSKEDNADEYDPIVINPKTGQQFSVRDYNITIQSIDCIVTNDNIYANVQKNAHPNSMQYNLRKNSHWQPLFSSAKEIARLASTEGHEGPEFVSIQPEIIDYSNSINHDSVSSLESRLENFLRDQLMNWRRQQAATFTPFNRYCTQIVRRILPQLESHACLAFTTGSVYSQQLQVITLEEALLHEMDEINAVHSIVGYPLHVSPLIEFEQIAQLVHSTGVHSLDVTFGGENGSDSRSNGKMVEFVVSVYVHAYPANVYSIWVYVGALVPKA